ncbi:dihydrofolate reductase family protein [Paractinoplanes lichenicola]|uniref:Dihydrofolate reductase family protein n=1 Tax=Paractinoplanes lichenicola TaxID=2802976 RepID=A0ABS1VDM1_9ACTN|nr:dihydrofolate reductase family protein [Actinoplanes lichenicola]MBL7252772.1 dihydrofolate reductase family protein [Actinoplanes lichenicola]
MGDIIVIQFVTLDGVVSGPQDWAFKYGPVTDDKFRLGERMTKGVQLYGRRTWEQFSRLWPGRDSDYAKVMNSVPKRVATRTGIDATAWENSAAIEGDPLVWAAEEERDVVVIGSTSLVRALATAGLVDEYRLLTFPAVAGGGDRLPIGDYRFTATELVGAAVLTVLRRESADQRL